MIRNCLYVLSVLGLLSGCTQKTPDGMPKLYPVAVTVTQDGSPLAGANVVLSGTDKWTPIGTTDAQGAASFYTQGNYPGVPEGTFKVSVIKILEEGDKEPPKPFDAESERVYKEYMKSGKKFRQFNTTPEKYRSAETTPLSVEIKKGAKDITVNVEGTVKDEIRQRGGVGARR